MIPCLLFALLTIGLGSPIKAQMPAAESVSLPKSGTVVDLPLSTKTHVPGNDLKANRYSLAVLATLHDRAVLVITSGGGKVESEFLAVPSAHQQSAAALTGPVLMKGDKKDVQALQGYRFADGSSVDFVYPKGEAVQLATVNNGTVLAIDPPSEGKPPVSQMSAEAQEVITLWLLTPVTVGPKDTAGIVAKRYEPLSNLTQASTSVSGQPVSASSPSLTRVNTASAVIPARPLGSRVHLLKELPHTASQQPLMILIGALCIGLASALALRRLSA